MAYYIVPGGKINMSTKLYNNITNIDNIDRAYRQALKGKTKYSKDAMVFSLNETANLLDLQKDLIEETYTPGGFTEFYVYEPKERLIHAPNFRDKIVQILVYNTLSDVYNDKFINDSYASIKDKGTHKCLNKIHHYLRKSKWEYGDNAHIIKIDMKKFFYSIDREILKMRVSKKVFDCKFKKLIFKLIDSAKVISKKGIPLGWTSSPALANVLMDKLDKYVKCKLGIKYYCRYMDDIFIVVKSKAKAREILQEIINYTKTSLKLSCNEKKTQIFPLNQGVNMVGFKIQTTHRLLRSDSKNRMKRKMRKLEKLYLNEKISKEKIEQILNSWFGHAKNGNCFNLVNKLIEDNNIFYLKDGRKITVKEEVYDLF